MTITDEKKKHFLKNDLCDSLRWLFVGAVAWVASKRPQKHTGAECKKECFNQDVLGMYTSIVQARALYDFFYKSPQYDDASARHFAPNWEKIVPKSILRSKYMAREKPVQKRVFHLVYEREKQSGGTGHFSPDDLNKKVLEFAVELRQITEKFARCVDPKFSSSTKYALKKALDEAELAARFYGITNPL